MKPLRKKTPKLPVIILFAIALCMVFLVLFTNAKFNELMNSTNESLLIHHDPDNPVHQELAEKILEFRPEACKMIEVYSMDFEQLFTVQFQKEHEHDDNNLASHTELIELFKNNKEGHTTLKFGDTEEDIFFQWIETSKGEPCLVIIYMSRPVIQNLWVFSLVCYIVLVLVFALILYSITSQNSERIRHLENYQRIDRIQ